MTHVAPSAPDDFALLRRQAGAALRTLLQPGAYLGALREGAHTAVHVAAYPLGLVGRSPLPEKLGDLLPTEGAAAMPVVLIHGYVHNRSAFLMMSRALKRAGFGWVHGLNYNPIRHGIGELAGMLATEIERVLEASGAEKVAVIGHSMGGIVARHYVQALGGEDTVDTVITLGAPHRGSYSAYLGIGPAAVEMRPGSPFLCELEATARPGPVRYVAYYSDLDFMVLPAVNAKLIHPALRATNIRLRHTGHLSLLLSGEVIRGVLEHLSDPELDRPGDLAEVAALPTASQRRRAVPRTAELEPTIAIGNEQAARQ